MPKTKTKPATAKKPKKAQKASKPSNPEEKTTPQEGLDAWKANLAISTEGLKLSNEEHLSDLLEETASELETIERCIEALEEQMAQLRQFKLRRQRLLQLKLTLEGLLSTESNGASFLPSATLYGSVESTGNTAPPASKATAPPARSPWVGEGNFEPELAFHQADSVLKRKDSMNYHLYKAIVLAGGKADIEQIRAYLVENEVRLPTSNQTFDQVDRAAISSRVHYLIRRGIVESVGTGVFRSCLGWRPPQ